jgi:hypothetical protein
MDRSSKEKVVSDLHSVFDASTAVVVTHYSGMTVAELGVLRSEMPKLEPASRSPRIVSRVLLCKARSLKV